MTEKPWSMEPEEDFNQPVERLGAPASEAAHTGAFGRLPEETMAAAAEESGWIPAAPMGNQRNEPVMPSRKQGAGGVRQTPASEMRVIDVPIVEDDAPAQDDLDPPRFSYSLGGEDEHGFAGGDAGGYSEPSDITDRTAIVLPDPNEEPFNFGATEEPVDPNGGDIKAAAHTDDIEDAQDGIDEAYDGGPIKNFLVKYHNIILYSGGSIAALAVCYSLFFGGHHQQQHASTIPVTVPTQSFPSPPVGSQQSQPETEQAVQANGSPVTYTQQTSKPGNSQVVFNSTAPVQPAPSAIQQAVPENSAVGAVVPKATSQPPQLGQASSATAQATAFPAVVLTSSAAQPNSPITTEATHVGSSESHVSASGAMQSDSSPLLSGALPAQSIPGQTSYTTTSATPSLPAVVSSKQLNAVNKQLKQLSESVSSMGTKLTASQSSMAETISQMGDQISNLQMIVLQLETKVAFSSNQQTQSTTTQDVASTPPPESQTDTPSAPPAPTSLGAANVASLPVLQGYSLQGYSKGAVVVGTPMGQVTVKINDTVPGAGTAEGLYRYDQSAGQYGIELVTDQGVIRPSAKSPY